MILQKLKKINSNLTFASVLIVGMLPILISITLFIQQQETLNELDKRLDQIEKEKIYQEQKQKANLFIHRKNLKADPEYLQNLFPHIVFVETMLEKYPSFIESEISFKKPIIASSKEIADLLEKIEAPMSHCPQLIVQDFDLERAPSLEEMPSFKLSIKLIKRDFL